ncbi:MAG: DUF3466 family protein, partial [Gammaproteobacteria bacterium]|nr:DUF3466 family protein [Gammaproteobacteria bacterium]
MNIQRHLGWTVVLIGLLPFFAAPALAASTYRIEQLPQYSADYPTASPGAINKNGIVVGSASSINTDSGESKALLWNEAGVLSDISAGSLYATAIDINDLGQTLLYLDGVFFILDQGTRMPLAVGNNSIYFNAINNAGQVTGWFT